LLQATNRLGDAESLMRRALAIIREFEQINGHRHPDSDTFENNYTGLLAEISKADVTRRTLPSWMAGVFWLRTK
jgi:hypothetical protein